jgi:hypothetical protein
MPVQTVVAPEQLPGTCGEAARRPCGPFFDSGTEHAEVLFRQSETAERVSGI